MSNVSDDMKSDCRDTEISQATNNTESKMQLNHVDNDDDDKNNVENKDEKMLDDDVQREDSVVKSTLNSVEDKDLEISETNDICKKDPSAEDVLKDDQLSIDNPAETNSCKNSEKTNDNEDKPKETIDARDNIDSTDICNPNNSDTANDNDQLVDSAKTCNDEKSPATISDECNDTSDKSNNNATISNDNVVEKVTPKRPSIEIDNDDSTDAIKSDHSDGSTSSLNNLNKCKTENLEHEDKTQSADTPKTQSAQREISNVLVKNQNDSSSVIDETEVTNKDSNVNKPVSEKADNNYISRKLVSLTSIMHEDLMEYDDSAFVQKSKRFKKSETLDSDAECITEEDKQGREHGRSQFLVSNL